MGDCAYFLRPDLKIRPLSKIVNEFAEILEGADCVIDFKGCAFYCHDELTRVLCPRFRDSEWRFDRSIRCDYVEMPILRRVFDENEWDNFVTLYISPDLYYEPDQDNYYTEVLVEAVYCPDILLEIALRYMERFPDALLFCESNFAEYLDCEDIKRIAAQPYDKDWYWRERSHRFGKSEVELDTSAGELKIAKGLTISRGYTFDQFRRTRFHVAQDGVRTISLKGTYRYFFGGKEVEVSLFFRDGVICMVSLVCLDGALAPEDEPKRKELHDRLLGELGIRQQTYDWGSVTSEYDPKSNISSINISYF